jgi:hypothetical protein
VDADVGEVTERTNGTQCLNDAGMRGLRITGMNVRERRATLRERHRMLTRVARLHMRRVIVFVFVVVRCGPVVLVCGEPVMVLGMIVIGVRVDVQRRDLAGCRGQDHAEQDRPEAMHHRECM